MLKWPPKKWTGFGKKETGQVKPCGNGPMNTCGQKQGAMSKLRIVLDTNGLLVSISRNSPYRPIFDHFLDGKYELLISTEILNEYIEKLQEKANSFVANNISEVIINAQNVIFVN
ncbi:MAG: PIN domain-containing protein, partial [Bacteroidetes bacterium]|nr:PIN domain-containing protein [Bacteroidota bacterium]